MVVMKVQQQHQQQLRFVQWQLQQLTATAKVMLWVLPPMRLLVSMVLLVVLLLLLLVLTMMWLLMRLQKIMMMKLLPL
jgi:hypothetical protein